MTPEPEMQTDRERTAAALTEAALQLREGEYLEASNTLERAAEASKCEVCKGILRGGAGGVAFAAAPIPGEEERASAVATRLLKWADAVEKATDGLE